MKVYFVFIFLETRFLFQNNFIHLLHHFHKHPITHLRLESNIENYCLLQTLLPLVCK
jgi:hypothetical protein